MKMFLSFIFILVLLGCRQSSSDVVNVSRTTVAAANNAFALRVYSELAERPGNVVVSPFSMETMLAMASIGASGETASQIDKITGLQEKRSVYPRAFKALLNEMRQTNDLGCQLNVANSLWVQTGFPLKGAFKKTIADDFGGQSSEIDFAASPEKACERINSWFKDQTHGRISEMIAPGSVHSQTDLVLANAAYFKGRWAAEFDDGNTQSRAFRRDGTNSISVPMMFGDNLCGYAETADVQVLEMFYTDPIFFTEPTPVNSNRFSMVIFLPRNIDGLRSLEHSLTNEKMTELLNQIAIIKVAVNLPKYSIGSRFDLKPALQKMGMLDAFLEDRADFSKISTRKPLFVNEVCHQSWLRVDESGTEAAAGSFLSMTHGIAPRDVKVFNADHPFLFMIRDNQTGIILFLGRVADPSKN
jgi:serpin B